MGVLFCYLGILCCVTPLPEACVLCYSAAGGSDAVQSVPGAVSGVWIAAAGRQQVHGPLQRLSPGLHPAAEQWVQWDQVWLVCTSCCVILSLLLLHVFLFFSLLFCSHIFLFFYFSFVVLFCCSCSFLSFHIYFFYLFCYSNFFHLFFFYIILFFYSCFLPLLSLNIFLLFTFFFIIPFFFTYCICCFLLWVLLLLIILLFFCVMLSYALLQA